MLALSLFSCRQTTKVRIEPVPSGQPTCYTYIKGKDTATLSLLFSGEVATGALDYKWFEKDKSAGNIVGELRGDTLIVDYTFKSEGATSVRQVAFLKKGDHYLEGFAAVVQKDGKTEFTDLSQLDFSNGLAFTPSPCK